MFYNLMKKSLISLLFISTTSLFAESAEVYPYPISSKAELLKPELVEFDKSITIDGNGSLKITAEKEGKHIIPLYEIKNPDLNIPRIFYIAKLKSKDLQGKLFIEMLCTIDGKGPSFSRSINIKQPETSSGWIVHKAPFFLDEGAKYDKIQLNLVLEGKGTCWIDDITLGIQTSWFNLANYSWIAGAVLGVFGAILGVLCGILIPQGKGAICLRFNFMLTISCIAMFAFGMFAKVHGQPREVWYAFCMSGGGGLVIFGIISSTINRQVIAMKSQKENQQPKI